jgi:hypothetical protein
VPPNTLRLLRAARLEMGAWVGPVTVMAHLGSMPVLTDFADMDYSADGDVMLVFKRATQNGVRLNALRYDASIGAWAAPATIYADPFTSTNRSRVAFRSDGSAVTTYYDTNIDLLSSRLFDGRAWVPRDFAIAGAAAFHETTADGLDIIMLYGDTAEFATWFKDSAVSSATLGTP